MPVCVHVWGDSTETWGLNWTIRSSSSVKGYRGCIVERAGSFIFFNFNFKITLELEKRWKNSTEISHTALTQLSLLLTSYIIIV